MSKYSTAEHQQVITEHQRDVAGLTSTPVRVLSLFTLFHSASATTPRHRGIVVMTDTPKIEEVKA